MKEIISSASLMYLYINGFEENGKLYLFQNDTCSHMGEAFFQQVMQEAESADESGNRVHIFAVVGAKEKVNQVYSIIKDGVETNLKRQIVQKEILTHSDRLDPTGNAFYKAVQMFFCAPPGHYAKRYFFDMGDFIIGAICCPHLLKKEDPLIDALISLWIEREEPELCGQQLMTRSFFMRDFVGRKVIAALPDAESGAWRLVFEGGHQLSINNLHPYSKGTVHPNDLQAFCSFNVQSIIFNPIYAYGKHLQPDDICEEWHKAFLYLCAVSIEEWTLDKLAGVYAGFLQFLEQNICLTEKAQPIFSKEMHLKAMMKTIGQFRGFLKGEDEPVISKDLQQTMNSRYVYLPYLWPIVKPQSAQSEFSAHQMKELITSALSETDTYKKGTLWEDAAAYVLSGISGWKITGRRIRAGAQEIDLSVANCSLDDDLWQLGAYILVECKNWSSHVDIHQIRNIAHISNMKGNKTAVLFAANGITADAQEEIHRLAAENMYILTVTKDDLLRLESAEECRQLFLDQWMAIARSVGIADVI